MRYAEKRMGNRGDGDVKNGFYPELSNMVTGAGWISAGPGYRHWLFNDQVLFDTSAAISWRLYKMAQVRLEMPKVAAGRVVVGTQVRWQDLTQVNNFGEGPDSLEADRNEYRLTSTEVVGYSSVKPRSWLSLDGRGGLLDSPELRDSTGPFRRGNPQTREVFPNDPVYQVSEQPSFVYGDLSLAADTRDARGHPTRGGFYRAGWSTFVDQDRDLFNFRRSELEAAHFIPAMPHVTLALHGWLVASNPSEGHTVPFYLQPSLGGANTLRGYPNYRFHDRNLLVLNAEGRVAVFTHVDAAVFVDAGNVAPRVGDLNLHQKSYGVGVRLHSRGSTMARLDFGRSREGWQILFRTNDPFRASRLSRRTAPVPFAP
ncbi:MAG: BamA/TamA family outer membrane protein [Acidobacteria bacterium]|nr:BamA/TamA family outer membrane protein [Acidobacteriota bacterium]